MAYCPECGAEFGRGIRRCPECRVDLLDELEEPTLYENSGEDLVLIQESAAPDLVARISEILGKHGILSVIEEVNKTKGQAAPGTSHILVTVKDEVRSRELLKSI